jgi:hypothetical protein
MEIEPQVYRLATCFERIRDISFVAQGHCSNQQSGDGSEHGSGTGARSCDIVGSNHEMIRMSRLKFE